MPAAGAAAAAGVDVFVAHSGESAAPIAFRVAEDLRDHGSAVLLGSGGSFKSQMKKADASNARYAVIIGEDEVTSGKVTLKNLRDGSQQVVTKETLINLGKS